MTIRDLQSNEEQTESLKIGDVSTKGCKLREIALMSQKLYKERILPYL